MVVIKPNLKVYIISAVAVLALFGILTLLLEVGVLNNFHRGLIILVCINVILAVSLNLSAGFLGQLVLGHAAFMAVGAYTAALISTRLGVTSVFGFIFVLIAGGLAAALSGIIIGVPALRLRGDYVAIVTLGFGLIIQSVLLNLRITGGADGLLGIPRLTTMGNAFFVMVIVVALLVALVRSRHGRAMIAIREDEIAAEASGIPTTYYKILGFTIAAFFAGVAGGLFAHRVSVLVPETFGFIYSIELLVIVVLGGMGSFTGAIVAAVVLTLLPELLREFGDFRMLTYSILLVAMMIFRPKGLMGSYEFSIQSIISKIRKRG
ncbi:MAG: branched-chain amino acid ABC transporter permease [Defluviitaleaceae bacterium]|nr:branched-chain amino acid ABC transporter permease [Defluviitaleaceae bacterium]